MGTPWAFNIGKVTSLKIRVPRGSSRPRSLGGNPQAGMRDKEWGDTIYFFKGNP